MRRMHVLSAHGNTQEPGSRTTDAIFGQFSRLMTGSPDLFETLSYRLVRDRRNCTVWDPKRGYYGGVTILMFRAYSEHRPLL